MKKEITITQLRREVSALQNLISCNIEFDIEYIENKLKPLYKLLLDLIQKEQDKMLDKAPKDRDERQKFYRKFEYDTIEVDVENPITIDEIKELRKKYPKGIGMLNSYSIITELISK